MLMSSSGELVGFIMFRFTLQGDLVGQMAGKPSLLVYDLQLKPQVQRKGKVDSFSVKRLLCPFPSEITSLMLPPVIALFSIETMIFIELVFT